MSHKSQVASVHSRYREELLKKLAEAGYITGYTVTGDKVKKITIDLKFEDGESAVTDVKLFSKPGRRWYITAKELKPVIGGLGHAFISTSKGILTNKEAKKLKLGGELLFEIW